MTGWRQLSLANAPIEIIDGDRGKNYPSQTDLLPEGYCLFLSTKNVRATGFDFSECQFITKDKDYSLRKGKIQRNDVVLTTRGTVGNLALYNAKVQYENIRINSGMLILRPDTSEIDPFFNYYMMRALRPDFDTVVSGSAQPQLPIKDLIFLEILLPTISEQKAIATVLSSLDDKIDLLHRQNATLEAMAEALFRQWFVVEAQQEWEEKTIGDIFEIKGGTTPKTVVSEYWNGNIHWTSPRDLSAAKSIFMFETERTITEKGLSQISSGLLPTGTLLLSSRAPIGYLAITSINVAINQGYIAILPDSTVGNYIMYLWCLHNMEEIKSSANGSVFQEISKYVFRRLSFTLPPNEIVDSFNKIVIPIFEAIKVNHIQIHTLEKFRDTLLPKLMSGEVRVEH